MEKKRTAILISGRGSNMAALVRAAEEEADFPARIVLVLSNRAEAAGLDFAREHGIPTAILPGKAYGADRAGFDAALAAELDRAGVDLLCLAGFMRLLTPAFCEARAGRIINIHPALLPSFKGLDTHARALAEGVKIHGCTTHFVTPGMDEGPIILQAAVPVRDDDDEASLAARVLAEEHRIYPETLRLLASGRLMLDGRRVRVRQ